MLRVLPEVTDFAPRRAEMTFVPPTETVREDPPGEVPPLETDV
jgi:hypothetical protein